MLRLLILCSLVALPASLSVTVLGSGCDEPVTPRLAVHGIDRADVDVDVENLGRLTAEEVEARAKAVGVDGVRRVVPKADEVVCREGCRWALVSVYIKNTTAEPFAPPVVRVDAPLDRPRRPPIGLGTQAIDPGRTGRIRWLIEMYPEEIHVDVRLSGSVFFNVSDPVAAKGAPEDQPAKPSP